MFAWLKYKCTQYSKVCTISHVSDITTLNICWVFMTLGEIPVIWIHIVAIFTISRQLKAKLIFDNSANNHLLIMHNVSWACIWETWEMNLFSPDMMDFYFFSCTLLEHFWSCQKEHRHDAIYDESKLIIEFQEWVNKSWYHRKRSGHQRLKAASKYNHQKPLRLKLVTPTREIISHHTGPKPVTKGHLWRRRVTLRNISLLLLLPIMPPPLSPPFLLTPVWCFLCANSCQPLPTLESSSLREGFSSMLARANIQSQPTDHHS